MMRFGWESFHGGVPCEVRCLLSLFGIELLSLLPRSQKPLFLACCDVGGPRGTFLFKSVFHWSVSPTAAEGTAFDVSVRDDMTMILLDEVGFLRFITKSENCCIIFFLVSVVLPTRHPALHLLGCLIREPFTRHSQKGSFGLQSLLIS